MLLLRRRAEEAIVITTPTGDTIRLLVLGIEAHRYVDLGLEAPREYNIVREERIAQGGAK